MQGKRRVRILVATLVGTFAISGVVAAATSSYAGMFFGVPGSTISFDVKTKKGKTTIEKLAVDGVPTYCNNGSAGGTITKDDFASIKVKKSKFEKTFYREFLSGGVQVVYLRGKLLGGGAAEGRFMLSNRFTETPTQCSTGIRDWMAAKG